MGELAKRLPGRVSWRRAALVALALAFLLALDRMAALTADRWALADLTDNARATAELRAASLLSEIEKQRTLPLVLAEDPDVRSVLQPGGEIRVSALNAKLEALAAGTRAGAIYLLDASGITIAASNYRTPESFVGSDYSFRPYFKRAIAEGAAEHFAFGTVSRRPGLYLTRRLDGPSGPIGVLVVKAEFREVEGAWRRFGEPTFVTDERSVILVTSEPDWRFRATSPIDDAARAMIRASLQFGDAPLDLLPVSADGAKVVRVDEPGPVSRERFVDVSVAVPSTSWTLHLLAPTEAATGLAEIAARSVAWLFGLVLLALAGAWLLRRRLRLRAQERDAAARRELEAEVGIRTAELRDTNERLVAEMAARRRARIALEEMQDELVQASKLAVLGQIAASVAHEVNQPVAAIRTFAENSEALIERGEIGMARSNLGVIAGLTDRIGAITGELRAFSRKTPATVERVPITAVVEGAQLLVGHRLRQQAIELDLAVPAELHVAAARIRLEQVFVNLLQNAIEALDGRPDGRIAIEAAAAGDGVVITVADNGPGLPPEVMVALFMPFTTTKPKGLGLGLVISHDIISEFGGTFAAENRNGAVFTMTLPRVD